MFKFISLITFLMLSQSLQAASVDPTRPFGQGSSKAAVSVEEKLVLESIVHGDGIHTVVINGKVLKPQEKIGQYRLVAVNDDSVILRSETERLKLYVFKASVLKVDDSSAAVIK